VKVVWLRRAAENFDAEKAYISQFNPTAAQRIAARIIAAVQLLEHHPEIGRPGRVEGTRELVVSRTRYIVPYRIVGDRVEILRVMHSSRKWPPRL
jgi:toxin ParE1/3/4